MGEVDGPHAAEITVRCDHAYRQAQCKMSGPEQRHPKHARLDEDDAAHVILWNLILPARHLAHFAQIDWRRVVMGVATFEPAQPNRKRRDRDDDGGIDTDHRQPEHWREI